MVQIGDRNRHHQKMTVNPDGSINTNTDSNVSSNEGDSKRVSNINSEQLLSAILKELKKIHLHLEMMNDTKINNSEVE